MPIEFVRQSDDGRITLVLVLGKSLVRSLWSTVSLDDIDKAREALRKRERIAKENLDKHIGLWRGGQATNEIEQRIETWANVLKLDAVIWTNLPPKFKNEDGRIPSADEVVEYLSKLPHEKRKYAERYVRMTPRKVDTDYRRYIEAKLNWTPLSNI